MEVVNELGKILNTVNIVVRGGRYQRNTLFTRPQAGNVLRNLLSRKLTTFTRLGSLSNLDLQLLRRDQKLWRHTETSTGNLVNVRVGRISILKSVKVGEGRTLAVFIHVGDGLGADRIFATLSRVRLSTHTVHSYGEHLMCLTTERTEGHSTGTESLHNILNALYLTNVNGATVGIKIEQITNVRKWSLLQTLFENFVIGSILRVRLFADGALIKTNSIVQ
mmetsp:Transcript_8072/g.11975  ORF Transcript_8072/g.11975 Transcript_8072/m.11975 type:complete len:221 (+) Transcript_8072:1691-2353(+)